MFAEDVIPPVEDLEGACRNPNLTFKFLDNDFSLKKLFPLKEIAPIVLGTMLVATALIYFEIPIKL